MLTLRRVVPVLCLAASLTGLSVYAASTTLPETAPAAGHRWHHHHHGGMGGMGFVLHKLNLTPEQKSQVKTLFADQKSQFQSLHASVKANREALATTPPTDSGYAALLETEKANAASRISMQSQLWTEIYSHVLTQAQRQAIPGIVAAARAARQAKVAAWKTAHPQSAN